MLSVFDVADFFLNPIEEENCERITNMKLQKLLYYSQGYALAFLGRPLFSAPIENWDYGPVVSCVYHAYKIHGANYLPPSAIEPEKYQADELAIMRIVRREKGQFTAWKLSEDTHNEMPWLSTNRGDVISLDLLQSFFVKTLPESGFNFDLARMKEAVETDFKTVPADALNDLESLEAWIARAF